MQKITIALKAHISLQNCAFLGIISCFSIKDDLCTLSPSFSFCMLCFSCVRCSFGAFLQFIFAQKSLFNVNDKDFLSFGKWQRIRKSICLFIPIRFKVISTCFFVCCSYAFCARLTIIPKNVMVLLDDGSHFLPKHIFFSL